MIIIDELDRELYGNSLKAIYGPYNRKADIRQHVVLYDGRFNTTLSYPKYLMERKLKRKLVGDEEVDHINENESDNKIENLQVLTKAQNIRKSSLLGDRATICQCTKAFRKKHKEQIFCSNSCRYKYTTIKNQYTK